MSRNDWKAAIDASTVPDVYNNARWVPTGEVEGVSFAVMVNMLQEMGML